MPRRRSRKFHNKRPSKRKTPWGAIRRHNRRRKPSSLEKTVQEWLTEDRIEFKKERTIGRCHVDIFLEPNICVELQGCHWHNCPQCVKTPSTSQKVATQKDIRRFAFFRSKGMLVVPIWEHDILGSPTAVRKILRGLGSYVQNRSRP